MSDAEQRYQQFIEQIAGKDELFVLSDGESFALLNSDGEECLPLWADAESAQQWSNDPALVRRVLDERPEDFPKSDRVTEGLRPLLGRSVFVTNGEEWLRQRRIIDPAFEGGRVKEAFPAIWAASEALKNAGRGGGGFGGGGFGGFKGGGGGFGGGGASGGW